MIKVVILACGLLSGEPKETCKEFTQVIQSEYPVSQNQCMNYSTMVLLPQFISEHPNLTVKKWFCDLSEPQPKI